MSEADSEKAWPEIMRKSEYAAYRREVFGSGSPSYISKLIAQGKLVPPALRKDRRIQRRLADLQIAALRDPARHLGEDDDDRDSPELALSPTFARERAATEALRRQKLQIELEQLKGRLVDRRKIEGAVMEIGRRLRDKLLQLPHEVVSPELVGPEKAEEIRQVLAERMREALTRSVDELIQLGNEENPPEDAEP